MQLGYRHTLDSASPSVTSLFLFWSPTRRLASHFQSLVRLSNARLPACLCHFSSLKHVVTQAHHPLSGEDRGQTRSQVTGPRSPRR